MYAHDPIILTDAQTTPEDGPLLLDGTVSFALYGTLNDGGDTRGVRARFAAGDQLDVTLLIPDLSPENASAEGTLPTLRIVSPDGTIRMFEATEKVRFDESFSNTSYVRLLEVHEPAMAGDYRFTVTAAVPARFTLAIGTDERFGTPVENVPNRSEGVGGVQRWYATPPPTTTLPATTTLQATTLPATTTLTSTTIVASTSTVVATSTTVAASAEADATTGLAALAIGASIVVVLIAALRRRGRRGVRRDASTPRPPTDTR